MRISVWLLLFPLFCFSQQPSHYVLGELEFQGIDIYDIHHAKDGVYWITTDNGLYSYDGYLFTRLKSDEMLSHSLFNLTEDHDGSIFCNNLSGQVFKVQNGERTLHYTIPEKFMSSEISLGIDNLNRLVVFSNRIQVIEANETVTLKDRDPKAPSNHIFLENQSDSSLWFHNFTENKLIRFKNNEVTEIDLKVSWDFPLILVSLNDTFYLRNPDLGDLFVIEGDSLSATVAPRKLPKNLSARFYAGGKANWLASNSSGLYRFDLGFNALNEGKLLFENVLISEIEEDREGNLLLGTFGEGIFVIPRVETEDIKGLPTDEKVISIASSTQDVFFGTRSGKVFKRDKHGDIHLLRSNNVQSIESLFCVDDDHLIVGEFGGVLVDLKLNTETDLNLSAVKDMQRISTDSLLVATNIGAVILNGITGESSRVPQLTQRLYCVAHNQVSGKIYAGTTKGLAILINQETLTYLNFNDKHISARSIVSKNDQVFVGTSDNGILVFKNDTVWASWTTTTGLISNHIFQMQIHDSKLFVATDKGLQIMDFSGNVLHIINSSEGLNAESILDFEVFENELWMVHRKGVQRIHLNQFRALPYSPVLELNQVIVNDSISASASGKSFRYSENKFAFHFKIDNLRYQRDVSYSYILEGAENQWKQTPFHDNIIEYGALSPGDYTFRAKAICRNQESKEVTYSFKIATPFYRAWWFYAPVSLGLVILVALWFRRRLRRQAFLSEQQNELNASKLTAIQSQMNPHFIFNALNSIQDLVLKGDVTNSYTYITKFADLVRRTLNYSDKDFIDFENELKLIELYLTLEKLRFKTNFEFTINASGIEDIQLPPMLVQPFIENALVHGLLHREGEKKLELTFELRGNLICTITDNGVGRERAKEIKERQRANHESFSVNAIKRRFDILKRNFGGELGFTTEDLEDNGIATGTRVRLVIPVKRKF